MQRVRQSILGQMVSASPCPACMGFGQVVPTPCETCRGEGRRTEDKSFAIEIPPGVDNGARLRLSGRGAAGPRGGGRGDLYVLLRVAETIAYAHDQGVIHRDLKPANIMVGTFGETYVLDWGLAKHRDRDDPASEDTVDLGDDLPQITLEGSFPSTSSSIIEVRIAIILSVV